MSANKTSFYADGNLGKWKNADYNDMIFWRFSMIYRKPLTIYAMIS